MQHRIHNPFFRIQFRRLGLALFSENHPFHEPFVGELLAFFSLFLSFFGVVLLDLAEVLVVAESGSDLGWGELLKIRKFNYLFVVFPHNLLQRKRF